jgi:uncharacterized protein Yka (UPF0111/DUF47 family)
MKTLKLTLICILSLMLSQSVLAQNTQEEVRYAIELADAEYKDIVRYNMDFTKQESNDFWPILNEYLNKRDQIFNKEINLYLKDYTSLNNEQAKDFLKKLLKYEKQMDRLQKKYFKKIMKVIPAKKFLRFVQIDDFIETARDFKLSYSLPLAKG